MDNIDRVVEITKVALFDNEYVGVHASGGKEVAAFMREIKSALDAMTRAEKKPPE